MDRRTFWRLAGSATISSLAGCMTPLSPRPAFEVAERQELPQPRMSPDAVVLEVAVVRFGNSVTSLTTAAIGRTAASSPTKPGLAGEGIGSDGATESSHATGSTQIGENAAKQAAPGEDDSGAMVDDGHAPAGGVGSEADGADGGVLGLRTTRQGIDADRERDFWRAVDEQVLPVELRMELGRNGFRIGVLRGTLPADLRRRLDEQRASVREIDPENAPDSLGGSVQRLQSRSGKRSKLLMGEPVASLSILIPENGRLSGRTFQSAQCLLSVKSFARGDGGADLEITPEVEHGEARQRWLGQSHEGTYRLDANRDRWQMDRLRSRLTLSPGQSLVLSCTDPPRGAGASFFARDQRESGTRRVVLVRLAQTQVDELFTERPASAALTTPLE